MNPSRPYSYFLRPGYGSQDLLFEFRRTDPQDTFTALLKDMLEKKGFVFESLSDDFLRDEFYYTFSSPAGDLVLSEDNWGFVFIITESQELVPAIDEMLLGSGLFEKEPVDFSLYEKP